MRAFATRRKRFFGGISILLVAASAVAAVSVAGAQARSGAGPAMIPAACSAAATVEAKTLTQSNDRDAGTTPSVVTMDPSSDPLPDGMAADLAQATGCERQAVSAPSVTSGL